MAVLQEPTLKGLFICMYVGMAWVHPWLIAMEGEYIRSTLIWWYACYYNYKGRFYVCGRNLGMSLADCSGRRVHKIDP